jgi:hypothetical protein
MSKKIGGTVGIVVVPSGVKTSSIIAKKKEDTSDRF